MACKKITARLCAKNNMSLINVNQAAELAKCEKMTSEDARQKCRTAIADQRAAELSTGAIVRPIVYAAVATCGFGLLFFLVWRFVGQTREKSNRV